MARGKRTGAKNRSASVSTPTVNNVPDQQRAGEDDCICCSKGAGDTAIGCDMCERWVHNTEMCSGLPQHMLDAIAKYDGAGINFICTKCRLDRGSSPSKQQMPSEVITQLFQQIKGLCSTVNELVNQVKALTSAPPPKPAPIPPPVSQASETPRLQQPASDYRSIVQEELKELREREKRKQSIIVKGLKATSTNDLASKFQHMSEQVMGSRVSLSDVSSISGHPDIFRAKVLNDDLRKMVLEKAKSLRNTDYNSVYISRDLTYAQRSELFTRRKARQSELGRTQDPPHVRPPHANPPPTSTATAWPTPSEAAAAPHANARTASPGN